METESEVVLGRDEVVQAILATRSEASVPIVVSSARGIGKSAVVAVAAKEAISRGHKVVFFSTQAKTDYSAGGPAAFGEEDAASLQLLLCGEFGDGSVKESLAACTVRDTSDEEGRAKIKGICDAMFAERKFAAGAVDPALPGIVFIDEFDGPLETVTTVLPAMPPSINLVFSRTSEQNAEDGTVSPPTAVQVTSLVLSPLDMTVKAQIVESRLGSFNKHLSSTQLQLLLANPGTAILRWIYLACEEIRVFGAFETVTEFIKDIPSTVTGLLQQNLVRNAEVARNYGDGTTALLIRHTLLLCYFEEVEYYINKAFVSYW